MVMNKKTISTITMMTLLSGSIFSQVKAIPIKIKEGTYSGQFKIQGLTPDFEEPDELSAHILVGQTINFEDKLYERLEVLNEKYIEYYWEARELSETLFESAMEKDTKEHWRYRDCVNFDYDKYISQEPQKKDLDDLWKKVWSIQNEMRTLIISYLKSSK